MKIEKVKNEETGLYEKRLKGEILEYAGYARPKLYGMRFQNVYDDDIRSKGVNKETRKTIKFYHITEVLFTGIPEMREMGRIRAIDHNVYSQRVNKRAISADDNKRCREKNRISTLALGHYRIEE